MSLAPDADATARAARAVRDAPALLVTAGAGMGVDSGLPDFRGPQGFWRAYPMFEKQRLRFEQLANPAWFASDPELAWGFYGHRLNLYRETLPHHGFRTLLRWASAKPHGAFVFTSNVDGHFQTAGFAEERVAECHGSLEWLQCLRNCGQQIFPSRGVTVNVDVAMCRAAPPLPRCPACRGLARPNVLMFGDWGWDDARSEDQARRLETWLSLLTGPPVILELGAGTNVPTVRLFSEATARTTRAVLVRVNPREPEVPAPRGISIATGALEAIRAIDAELESRAD